MDEPVNQTAEEKDLLRGFLSYLGLRSVGIVLGYVTQIFLSRWLGVHHFGVYSVLATVAFVLAYVAGLGYPTAAERFLPNYRKDGEWASFRGLIGYAVRKMALASVPICCLGGAALAALHATTAQDDPYRGNEALAILFTMLLVPVQGAQEVYEAGLTAQKRWMDSFVPSLVLTPVLFMVGVAAVDYAVPGELTTFQVLAVYLVVNTLSTGVQKVLLHRSYPPGSRDVKAELKDSHEWDVTSKPVLIMTMFGILTARADLFGVVIFDGHADAGIYAAVLVTAELLNTFSKAANTVVMPHIGPLLAEKKLDALQRVLVGSSRLATYPSLVGAIFLTYAGKEVLEIFGPGFSAGYAALVVLSWNQVLIASAGPPAYVLIVAGQGMKVARGFALSLAIQLVLLVGLTWKFHMVGASTSSLLAGLFLRTLLAADVRKTVGLKFGLLGGMAHEGSRGKV